MNQKVYWSDSYNDDQNVSSSIMLFFTLGTSNKNIWVNIWSNRKFTYYYCSFSFNFQGDRIGKITVILMIFQWQLCWWHRYVGDYMMVTDLRFWWRCFRYVDVFQWIKSVTIISNLSPIPNRLFVLTTANVTRVKYSILVISWGLNQKMWNFIDRFEHIGFRFHSPIQES